MRRQRKDARVAEEARLESAWPPKAAPGFESLSFRKKIAKNCVKISCTQFFVGFLHSPAAGGQGCGSAATKSRKDRDSCNGQTFNIKHPCCTCSSIASGSPGIAQAAPAAQRNPPATKSRKDRDSKHPHTKRMTSSHCDL